MSHMLQTGADKLPTILGGGILGVAGAGLALSVVGLPLTIAIEGLAAVVGMVFAGRHA